VRWFIYYQSCMKKKKENRCWACRKKIAEGKLFCKECEKKPEARKSGTSTYVIYHKV
jgi:predicted amidophosphoribosyltransferase